MTRTIYTTTAHNGFEFLLLDVGLGRVGNVTVTDCDCSCCGDVGIHSDRLCDHQRDLMLATVAYMADEMPLPFDAESDAEFGRWRKSLYRLQEKDERR